MPLEQTLEKVRSEIAEGRLGIARDRLQGLIVSYPLDLSIRSLLGDVNSKLGYPVEAGRWWFLDSELDETKRGAVHDFVDSCHGKPSLILHKLRLQFHPDQIETKEIRSRIEELVAECQMWGSAVPTSKRARIYGSESAWKGNCSAAGCLVLGLLILIFDVIGVVHFVELATSRR